MLKFITSNKKKAEELANILSPLKVQQVHVELEEIQSLNLEEIILHKINQAKKIINGEFIVEDSGMSMKVLGGKLPGPLVKWFNQSFGMNGYYNLVNKIGENRAFAETVFGLYTKKKNIKLFKGEIKGKIVKPQGNYNFGYDQVFMPEGKNKTLGELKELGDFSSSPRGIAAKKLKKYLTADKSANY